MSHGVSNETPWNSDAYDTKNATIPSKMSISLDLPTIRRKACPNPEDGEKEKKLSRSETPKGFPGPFGILL